MDNGQLRLQDSICPICLCILIEPVTMPCSHELCLPCFKQNVYEANFECPLCRKRISTWTRKAARTNTLVNKSRWELIQKSFPDRVQRRINGEENDDGGDEMEALRVSIRLAEPGEIRMEYEAQLKKLELQRSEQQQSEFAASEMLIQQLQEEEKRKQEEEEEIRRRDEELAKQLNEAINQGGDSPYGTRSSYTSSVYSDRSNNNNSIETFINKMKEKDAQGDTHIPYPYRCYTPTASDKLVGEKSLGLEDAFKKQKLHEDRKLLTTQDLLDLEQRYKYGTIPRAKSNISSTVAVGCLGEVSRTASRTDSVVVVDSNELLNQMSEALTIDLTDDLVCDTEVELDDGTKPRSTSSQSNDSITQELSHFRPIRACPLTPPRRLASGRVVEAPLIRTTPRNLGKTGLSSPTEASLSDIDASSPIMQRRLEKLAEERKDQVRRLSKSTATGLEKLNDSENRNPKSRQEENPSPVASSLPMSNNVGLHRGAEFKDISNSPQQKRKFSFTESEDETVRMPAKKKMIIPLEANFDDCDDLNVSPTLMSVKQHNSAGDSGRSNVGNKSGGKSSYKLATESSAIATTATRARRRRKHSGKAKSELEPSSIISPQRSITDWMTKSADINCSSNGLENRLLSGRAAGRDEVDGQVQAKRNRNNSAKLTTKKPTKPTCTIDKFITTESCDSSPEKRLRKELKHPDYVYNDVAKKPGLSSVEGEMGAPVHKLNFDLAESSDDGFNSDGDSEGEDGAFSYPRQKKSIHNRKAVKRKANEINDCNIDTYKQKNHSATNKDIASESDTGTLVSLNQEEEDRRFAMALQKQFEIEAKLRLTGMRFKGSDGAYMIRNRRK